MITTNSIKERNFTIDIIRCLCIILIMFAHTMPQDFFYEVRAFDVVGLVFVSVFCTKKIINISNYRLFLKKRVNRLLFPSYMIITIVLIVTWLICFALGTTYPYSTKSVVLSYLLIDGIGYVWVFRVFLLLAIVMPIIQFVVYRIKDIRALLIICTSILVLSTLLSNLSYYLNSFLKYVNDYYVITTLSYATVAIVAYKYRVGPENERKILLIWALICFGLFTLLCTIDSSSISIVNSKYPPRGIYISYGLVITLALLRLFTYLNIKASETPICKVVGFISRQSFSIYFAHIIIMKTIQFLNENYLIVNKSYWLAVFVSFLSIIISFITLKIMNYSKRCIWNE